jgi:hypothetical protein
VGVTRVNETGQVDLLYNPYQMAFLDALDQTTPSGRWAYNRLTLFAGRRGGKTKIGALAAAKKATKARTTGWVTAPTYDDLHTFVIPAVLEYIPRSWLPGDGGWSESHKEQKLVNGSLIQFRSLEDPDKARGPGLDWAWIDETRKVNERAWDTMLPALVDCAGQAWFTTSPNGFDWCYSRLWLPAVTGMPGFWACKYRSLENPKLDPQEIAQAREQLDPKFFLQEFEADFVTFSGAIYDLERAILHTDEEVRALLPEWPLVDPSRSCIVGLDPGADHPFAGTLLVACERGLVVLGEYLQRDKPVMEHRNGLLALVGQFDPGHPLVPSCWAVDRSQRQFATELAQFGIYVTPAENAVVDGIRRVQSWLAAHQLFFVETRVPRTIEQMRGYQWAENTAPDGTRRVERPLKQRDDLPDAVRYALMTWPELPQVNVAPSDGLRDLSTMPASVQWAMQRNRAIAAKEREEYELATQDLDGFAFDPHQDFFASDSREEMFW